MEPSCETCRWAATCEKADYADCWEPRPAAYIIEEGDKVTPVFDIREIL